MPPLQARGELRGRGRGRLRGHGRSGPPADPPARRAGRGTSAGDGGAPVPPAQGRRDGGGDRRQSGGAPLPAGRGSAVGRRRFRARDRPPPGHEERPRGALLPPFPRCRKSVSTVRRRRTPPEQGAVRASRRKRARTLDARGLRSRRSLGIFAPGPLSRGVRDGGNGLLRLLPRRPAPSRRPDASAGRRDHRELPAPGHPRVRACGVAATPPARRPRLRRWGDVHLLAEFTPRHGAFVPPLRPGRVRSWGTRPRGGGRGRVDGRQRLFRGRGSGGVSPRFRVRAAPGVSVPGAGPSCHSDAGVLLEEMPVLPRGGRSHPPVPGDGPGNVSNASAGVVRPVRRPAVSPDGQRDPGRHPPVDGGRGERAARLIMARVRPFRTGTARTGVRLLAGRRGMLDASTGAGERLAAAS